MQVDFGNVRYGTRTLLHNRGLAAVAVITLALGIGATTAMFSVVEAVLLRSLPYRNPDRLAVLFEDLSPAGFSRSRVSPPAYLDFKSQKQLFRDVAAVNETAFNLSEGNTDARQLNGVLATSNLFSVLGIRPLLGRLFAPEEDRPGASHVVLLSYALWRTRFRGSSAILGQTLRLNAEPYTVIGVMPPGFSFPEKEPNPIDIWTPRAFTPGELTARRARYLIAIGRLQPGISLNRVNAELRVLATREALQNPNDMRDVSRFFAEPLQESDTHEVKQGLLLLVFAVTVVLLIACANVANLLLSRASARRPEFALRAALGARRGQLVRQLLTEGALLSIAGGTVGTALAVAAFGFLKQLVPADLSHSVSLHFNLSIFAFAMLVCLASSFLFGLAPALNLSKTDLNDAVRQGGRGSTASRPLLGVFVAGEVALSLMLLIGAGLLLKSLYALRRVDPGFRSDRVLTLDFDMAEPRYRDWNVRTRFQKQVLSALRALPGVASAGFTGDLPLTSKGWNEEVTPEGVRLQSGRPINLIYNVVTPGYLEALGVSLVHGRLFSSFDNENAPLVAVINQKAAQDFWPGQNPIGKRLKLGRIDSPNPWLEIVGVAGNVKHAGLNEPVRGSVYCPYLQARSTLQWQRFLVVRARRDPLDVAADLRRIVASIDPDEPLNHVVTLAGLVQRDTSQTRIQTTLLAGFAALALTMASVGIYGVMAYLVTQRTREIGVRVALGARKSQIVGLVVARGMLLALLGTAAGISAAVALARLLGSLLYGVSPTDPAIVATGTIVLNLMALAACLVPARRAATIDPVEALRAE